MVTAQTYYQNEFLEKEIRLHDKHITNWLQNYLGDAETAADVKQSVFVRVLEYSLQNQIENPKALMFRIARNLAVNEIRRRKRFGATFVQTDDYSSTLQDRGTPSDTPTPEEEVTVRNEMDLLSEEINRLPQRQKLTFILNRVHGLKYRDIALRLNVSESSVEKYMMKTLKTLREALER